MFPRTILEKDFGIIGKLYILDEGDGYYLRAIRSLLGTAMLIVIDEQHPNRGYFSDAMLFVKTMHMDKWMPIPIATWTQKYHSVEDFIRDYPMLEDLFDDSHATTILEDLFSMAGD